MKVTVCDLIKNQHTQFTEDDREWLTALNEDQLALLVPVNIPEIKANKEEPKPVTFEQLLNAAGADVQAQFKYNAAKFEEHKAGLLARIKANENNKLTDEQLAGMGIDMLESIANSIAPVVNYQGNGGAHDFMGEITQNALDLPSMEEPKKQ